MILKKKVGFILCISDVFNLNIFYLMFVFILSLVATNWKGCYLLRKNLGGFFYIPHRNINI